MRKKIFFPASVLLLAFLCSNIFAWNHYGYANQGGSWHNHGYFGIDFDIGYPSFGTFATSLPFGCSSIMSSGIPYYYYGNTNTYFSACPGGYIVVPAPQPQVQIISMPAAESTLVTASNPAENRAKTGSFIVISIPKKSGGFIPVRLIKEGNGYIGPQGEFYTGHPTVKQLSALYGD